MENNIDIDGLDNHISNYDKGKKPHRTFRQWWREGRHKLYAVAACLAILLLALLLWHKQVSDMVASLLGTKPASSNPSLATTDGASPAGGSGSSTTARNATNSTQETAKTTTTTTTTTTNTPTDNGGTAPASNNLLSLSTNVKPGLTLDQVTNLANGVGPSTCTDIGLTNLIQTSVCTWTADGKSVVVTLQNGVVTGPPVKLGF